MSATTGKTYMQPRANEYTERVDKWLSEHGIVCVIERIGSSKGFPGEKAEPGRKLLMHDTYHARFMGGRHNAEAFDVPLYFQSAAHSESQIKLNRCNCDRSMFHTRSCPASMANAEMPTAYDILSCMQKGDPGTFEDFCSDYGYDTDSRTAEQTYFAVQQEWSKMRRFFTAEEIEQLQEIAS